MLVFVDILLRKPALLLFIELVFPLYFVAVSFQLIASFLSSFLRIIIVVQASGRQVFVGYGY